MCAKCCRTRTKPHAFQMKCKKIANKLNNFVVQTLRKIKNHEQNSTMPAMPKEKSSILAESNYSELKMKDNLGSIKKDLSPNDTASTTTAKERLAGSTKTDNKATEAATATAKTKLTANGSASSSGSGNDDGGSSPTPITKKNDPNRRTPNDFRFGKSIGEGSFSTVYLAKDIHSSREYAIKVCEKQQIIREKKQDSIKREREVMHALNGVPGFVNLYCTFQDYKNLYFVITFAKNGDLLPYINKHGSFDLRCSQFYAAELLIALEHMHRRGIIHRDLKPENILFDERMHTLIADFGSAKMLHPLPVASPAAPTTETSSATATGEVPVSRSRTNSFVGTAQYVSPEILTGQHTTKAADLWAYGCIIYQMISGLPPFRAGTEYLIFQKILKLDLSFPEGFDDTAKDLVEKLLQLNPADRLGATDSNAGYDSIRAHPFFKGTNWSTLRSDTPPSIYPYLPGMSDDDADELLEQYRVPDHLEPGLDDRQMSRLLGLELGMASNQLDEPRNILNIPDFERQRRLEVQRNDKWHQFVDGEVILKQGFVNKRKGLFARKRMLLLTTGPRLVYVDPVQMVKKGEIPWSADLRVEIKNFKMFFVHTPNRTYYLEDPAGFALKWCQIIDDVRTKTYGPCT